MPDLDPASLRARYQHLSDEALAELHAAGPGAYQPAAWAALDAEFKARTPARRAGEPPPAGSERPGPLVAVFASSDPARLIVAKLLLGAEGIPFVSAGEGVQDLIGLGRAFGGYNLATGPVQMLVAEGDAARAAGVLQTLGPDP